MLWGVKFFGTTVQKKISPSPFPTAFTRRSRAPYNRSKDNKCTAGVEGQFIPRLRSSVPGHLSARKSRFPLMPCKTRNKIYHYSISIAHSNVKNWDMHRSLFHLTLLLQRTLRGIFSFFFPHSNGIPALKPRLHEQLYMTIFTRQFLFVLQMRKMWNFLCGKYICWKVGVLSPTKNHSCRPHAT